MEKRKELEKMALQELDFQRVGNGRLKDWLSQISMPVVIFAWSDWRKKAECEVMKQGIEIIAGMKKYSNSVIFYWLNADEHGDICRELSIGDTPCVVVLKNGKEIIKFSSATSGSGLMHHLDNLLDPVRNHNPARTLAPGVSVFSRVF